MPVDTCSFWVKSQNRVANAPSLRRFCSWRNLNNRLGYVPPSLLLPAVEKLKNGLRSLLYACPATQLIGPLYLELKRSSVPSVFAQFHRSDLLTANSDWSISIGLCSVKS